MSSQQPAPADPTVPEDPQYNHTVLRELIGLAMDLARTAHATAKAQLQAQAQAGVEAETGTGAPDKAPRPPAAPDPTAPFDRMARCVRRTVLLAEHLAALPRAPRPDPARDRRRARQHILREVEDRIGHVATTRTLDTDALNREALDRLDTLDHDGEVTTRPVPELVDEICRDLGLHNQPRFHPHRRRTPPDVRRLQAHAATPASHDPLPQPAPQPTPQPTPSSPPGTAPPLDDDALVALLLHGTPP